MTEIVRNRRRSDRASTGNGKAAGQVPEPARVHRAQTGAGSLPMLRTSERGTFKRCHWKWWWEFEERLKPTRDIPPLRFGSLVHMALADYYKPGLKRGGHPAAAFRKHYAAELKLQESFGFKVAKIESDDAWVEAGTLGEAMLNHYVDHYGKDDEWEVIVTEQPFQQVVYKPWTYDTNHPTEAQQSAEPWFIYVGQIDGIWRSRKTKKLHIVDHKTAKAIQVGYLSLDGQATGYWTWGLDWIYANGLLKPNQKPAGMLYNHLRKTFPDDRPFIEHKGRKVYLNQDGSESKKQPTPYFVRTPIYRDFNERWEARRQVEAEFADMQLVRAGGANEDGSPPAGAYKNQGQFTCPGCWCFDFCELHEIGAEWTNMIEFASKQWDPYAAHNIYADETH